MTRSRAFALAVVFGCLCVSLASRFADAQYSPAGGNTFGGLSGLSGGAVATGPGTGVTTLYLGDANYLDGQLPVGFQQAQTLAGCANGTTAAVTGLYLSDAACVSGVLPTANQASQSLGGSLGGTTASGTVLRGDGTGTSAFGSGTNFTQNAAEVTWQVGSDAAVLSYGGAPQLTTASTWVNCGTYSPASVAPGTVGLGTCQILGQDSTATLDGGQSIGHASSGTLVYSYAQAGADAGGLTVTSGTFAPTFTNAVVLSAQAVLDAGTIYTQVEFTDGGSIYVNAACACNLLQVR